MPEDALLRRLEADGIVRFEPSGRPRTTRKWQSAMARAAFHLYGAGDDGLDLRVPVAPAHFRKWKYRRQCARRISRQMRQHLRGAYFGLERITLALFHTHGLDSDHWPPEVRSALAL